MNPIDLDKVLRETGKELRREVPGIIRRRQDEVYAALAELPMQTRTKQKYRFKKARKFMGATAAAAIIGVMSSAFLSPIMAESLKNIPLVGSIFKLASDLGLRTAEERGLVTEPNASVTHEGVTIRIPQVVYDGSRLSLAVKREGSGLIGGISDYEVVQEGENIKQIYQRGAITNIEMFVDGTSLYDYSGGKRPGLTGNPTSDPNAVLYQLTAYSHQGEGALTMPDQFLLTAKITLEGIEEPFIIDLPVRKSTDHIVVPSGETREWGGLKLTLEQLTLTPITTDLIVNIEPSSKSEKIDYKNLLYEVWDDRGRVLGLVAGMGIYNKVGQYHTEMMFDRFEDAPDTITLKPFLPVFQDPSANSGLFEVDSNGEIVKKYLKDLEIIVPVDRVSLEKLYDIHP
ncbi:DUF4179 domain-containing protein [Paenibacillus sp. ISL-20]|uniref:DUF4179 domain-containing protein n=1 Tax=Paenibacillus sp. ISL-20 TaxID=2819163 RepID=UPI001BE9F659|nr:DUF4179 domain-containing protein [Paenibacillus sp. ISL-20]MBT2764889.1 DUF4179 domain-containing protein [Paenibacillus sp. ISL-20]